jgi:hypothetical protein
MALSNTALQRFHDHLVELFGSTDADSLMSVLTTADTANLATKDDVRELRTDVDHQVELLRADMATTKHELIGVFRGELLSAVTSLNRNLVFSVIGAVVATATAVITASHFG